MSQRIKCCTLFDITQTGVLNRARSQSAVNDDWLHRRNTQCNFDTVLQVISLRSQPEIIKVPHRIAAETDMFGRMYNLCDVECPAWCFEFEVQHSSVFENGIQPLGLLYNDCHEVPMLHVSSHLSTLSPLLDTSLEFKNIHFEVL